MKVVIAGLGAGGFAAALTIKKWNRKADVVFVDPKPYDLMHPCGLPYALEGVIPAEALSHHQDLDKMKITKISGRMAGIDRSEKVLRLESGEEVGFDKLIIATGASPFKLPIPGIENSYTLESPRALQRLLDASQTGGRAVVIGGGAIGLEAAWGVKKRGMQVTVLEMSDALMGRSLDPDFSELLKEYLQGEDIDVRVGARAEEITSEGVICEGELLPADLVVNAAGFAPDLKAAKEAGLVLGRHGIITDKTMQTSDPHIYAVGDCIETFSPLVQGSLPVRLATTAYRQGVIAGAQIAGKSGRCWEYSGSLMTFVSAVGEWEVAACGLTAAAAKEQGYSPLVSKVKGSVEPDWMAGAHTLNFKLVIDKESRLLLGAQAVGSKGAAERINLAALAMRGGLKAEELLDLEMAYCPAVSKTWDIFNTSVENSIRRLKL